MSCYALIKTIYRSKCTCIEIATFLLWYRLLLLYCGLFSRYRTFKAFFSNIHSSVTQKSWIHWISEPVLFFFLCFSDVCCYTGGPCLWSRHSLMLQQRSSELSQDEGERADGMTYQESDPLVHLSKTSLDETYTSLINSSFWLTNKPADYWLKCATLP